MSHFEPDLFLVYMGNNEVVGPYGPGCAYLSQMPPLWVIRASVFVRSTRTGQLIGSLIAGLSPRRRPPEWGGMSMFVDNAVAGDDPRLRTVYENFEANLRGIVKAASGVGARTVLCTVVANLKDCPPFLSPRQGAFRGEAWPVAQGLRGRAPCLDARRHRARAVRLNEALQIDPQFADAQFMLGSLDMNSGDIDSARRHLVEALHWDALRFRPDPAINQVIRKVAHGVQGKVIVLDAAVSLGADPESTAPPCGREMLFEHVHFDWDGNYRMARLMARCCAAAIFGDDPGDVGWRDKRACADALAYTGHERLPMLLRIDVLVRKPPFTGQLTHVEDEARMAREIDEASQAARSPEAAALALAVARSALEGDPENPALAGILEGIELDLGDLREALALSQRAGGLLPKDFALAADEASILVRLCRYDEAEKTLMGTAGSGADLDLLAPVFADLWTRSGRLEDGMRFFDGKVAGRPHDLRLRIVRAGLLKASGDVSGAEREFRAILAEDPSSQDALGAIVSLLDQSGRKDEADRESLLFAKSQPGNQENSLRAARYCEARGDADGSVENLRAAELSGPVTATFELDARA